MAFGILSRLPVELILQVGSNAGFAMVFALLIGAIGGASLNLIFTNHFNAIAWGHFTVRRLERRYGEEAVRRHYLRLRAEKS